MLEPGHILEVCPAVVKGISVDVMTNKVDRRVGDEPVHTNEPDAFAVRHLSAGVVFASGFFSVPADGV